MNTFRPADILFPQVDSMEKWAVIACDQFTSQPEYWEKVGSNVGDAPSTLSLILPETELSGNYEHRVEEINRTMAKYLQDRIFKEYANAYIYVERTLMNGAIRKGLIGAVDLEEYDYAPDAVSNIRATEKTVVERIPPRKKIRKDAPIELPHILLLCDDDEKLLVEPVTEMKSALPLLYDFDLMEEGGHISGWLLQGDAVVAFEQRMQQYVQKIENKYQGLDGKPMLFAVGDGNHSLATAKACYEELKKQHPGEDLSGHPARYALVELENIHDEAQKFEAIHRIIKGTEPEALLKALKESCCVEGGEADGGFPVEWYSGNKSGVVYLDKAKGQLPVGILQNFLDHYLSGQESGTDGETDIHKGEIDYIHGDDTLKTLAEDKDAVGFLLPAMEKGQLFPGIIVDGVLPRKTFSMGHAQEKRYYLEARKIR